MDEFVEKAKRYFKLATIAEKMNMHSEAASNYFKALSAINDSLLAKLNLRVKDHTERFSLLRRYLPKNYEITDKIFLLYRRTYTQELTKEEVEQLRLRIEEVMKDAAIDIPRDEEIDADIKKILTKK